MLSPSLKSLCWCMTLLSALSISSVMADGSSVGQIYAPYVQPLEKEIELVAVYDARAKDVQIPSSHWGKIGYGTSLWDNVYTEFSVTNIVDDHNRYYIAELEGIWQLTEQGEYNSDWGMLFELEMGIDRDANEFTVGVLNSKDFGNYTLLTNGLIAVEWGDDIGDEVETSLAMQLRYRWSSALEPTMEFFLSQDTFSIGPGLTGVVKLDGPKQLRWNFAALAGLENTSQYSVKLELEYEFF